MSEENKYCNYEEAARKTYEEYEKRVKEGMDGVHIHDDSEYGNDEKFLEHIKNMRDNPIDIDSFEDLIESRYIEKYKKAHSTDVKDITDWVVAPYEEWDDETYQRFRDLEKKCVKTWGCLWDIDSAVMRLKKDVTASAHVGETMDILQCLSNKIADIILGYIRYTAREEEQKEVSPEECEKQYEAAVVVNGVITREKRDIPEYEKFKEAKAFIEKTDTLTISPEGWVIPQEGKCDLWRFQQISTYNEAIGITLDVLIKLQKNMRGTLDGVPNYTGIGPKRITQAIALLRETNEHLRLLRNEGWGELQQKINETYNKEEEKE